MKRFPIGTLFILAAIFPLALFLASSSAGQYQGVSTDAHPPQSAKIYLAPLLTGTGTPAPRYTSTRPPIKTPPPKSTNTRPPTPTKTRPTKRSKTPTPTLQIITYTPTETGTATNTVTETPAKISTSEPPSSSFTPTPEAGASSGNAVRLNELLTHPGFKDWNTDGAANALDQWIEVFNAGDHPVDLKNWWLDTGEGTAYFIISENIIVPPLGFAVLFQEQFGIELSAYSHLRLIRPSGLVADEVYYPSIAADRVYARAVDGKDPWRTGCVPTPLASNCQEEETYTSQFNLPFFQQHIAGPTKALDVRVLATNLFLSILLALAVSFFGNLLNDAMETNEEDIKSIFGPVLRFIERLRGALLSLNRNLTRSRLPWVELSLKVLVILLVYGIVLAYLDPAFHFLTRDSFLLVIALGLSTGFVALVDDLAAYIYLRRRGAGGEIRLHGANFLLVILSTFFSRLTGLVPGLLIGSPAGIEDVPEEHSGPFLDFLAIAITAAFGILAWVLILVVPPDPWLNTLLLLVFAAGIQTVFFEMLPISYLHGKNIFKYNRLLWLVLFSVAATVFLQTMLNPDGDFLSAFQHRNMVLLSLSVLFYCVFCTLIWYWLNRLARKRQAQVVESTDKK